MGNLAIGMVEHGYHPEAVKLYMSAPAEKYALTGEGMRFHVPANRNETVAQYYDRLGYGYDDVAGMNTDLKVSKALKDNVLKLEHAGEINAFGKVASPQEPAPYDALKSEALAAEMKKPLLAQDNTGLPMGKNPTKGREV